MSGETFAGKNVYLFVYTSSLSHSNTNSPSGFWRRLAPPPPPTHTHKEPPPLETPICRILLMYTVFYCTSTQKLQERMSTLQKADMPPTTKDKWAKVLQPNVMSSEESAAESEDVFIKPIPWRAECVNSFFMQLDEKRMERKHLRPRGSASRG